MWPALTFLEEFMIFIPTESDLWACKLTRVLTHICVLHVFLSTSEETKNNGTAHWVHPHRGRIQRQRIGDGGGGGGLGWAIFLLSVCQMKVRERLRGVRWQGTEVGSPFRQEMGWKTSGIQFWGFFLGGWFNPEREKNEQRERLNNVIWVHFAFEFVYISRRMSHCALFRWKYYFIRVCMWVQQMTLLYFLPLWVNHFQFMSVTEYFLLGWNLACEDRQRTFLPLRDLISLL